MMISLFLYYYMFLSAFFYEFQGLSLYFLGSVQGIFLSVQCVVKSL
jgi:hypothetical protein